MKTRAFPTIMLILLMNTASEAGQDGNDQGRYSRIIKYAETDVVEVRAKVRYTTLLVLPKDEEILDYACGDKEFWIINGTGNFAHVKPARANSQTNINLIAASGKVYSFVVQEVSSLQDAEPDLKVFVEPRDETVFSANGSKSRFVRAEEVAAYREIAEAAQREAHQARESAAKAIEEETSRFVASYPLRLHFGYRYEPGKKPFQVTAIYDDGRFTYIRASSRETPSLYELKDGRPSLVEFQFRDGTYIVPKLVEHGYLAIGKARMLFSRKE